MRWIPALLLLLLGCGPVETQVTRGIPTPGAGIPYGLLGLETDPGDTVGPRLVLERTGFVPREIRLEGHQTLTLRAAPGKWKVRITGKAGKGEAIRFHDRGAKPPPVGSGGRTSWPSEPIEVQITRNKLTWAGRFCAHADCKAAWVATEPKALTPWRETRRLLVHAPPKKKKSECSRGPARGPSRTPSAASSLPASPRSARTGRSSGSAATAR